MAKLPSDASPSAVLWDMDGTLVDTEPYWMRSETELVEAFGGTWSHEDALEIIGFGLENAGLALQKRGVELAPYEISLRLTERVREQLREFGVPWRPGALALLDQVAAAGIPQALVTMSRKSMAMEVVEAMPANPFAAVITGDQVENPKPHPEPYLLAAETLGVMPGRCAAIEDSPSGLASALASGAKTVGVPHIAPLPEGPGHTLWRSLEGKTLQDLTRLFTEA